MKERILIVGLENSDNKESYDVSMEELWALADSAGGEVLARIDQKGPVNPRTYIGPGKVKEVRDLAQNMDASTIIFNTELSGSQVKNLEDSIDKKILDRTNLILDIFATRARTKEAVLQVSLAQLKYLLPRLEGYSKNLSRTGGGIGTRGPGEQQLETDRRHIRNQIARIESKLKDEEKKRKVRSKRRKSSSLSMVAMVGYTNAGKSTIMNRVLDCTDGKEDKKVYKDDRLFASLQTSHRYISYQDEDFILVDTVGLIEDLPLDLIDAFKSTLEEARDADILLIVLDASTDNLDRQISSINKLIEDMSLGDKRKIFLYNKIDKRDDLSMQAIRKDSQPHLYISALEDRGIQLLLQTIKEELDREKVRLDLFLPYSKAGIYSKLLDKYKPEWEKPGKEGILLAVDVEKRDYKLLQEFEVD